MAEGNRCPTEVGNAHGRGVSDGLALLFAGAILGAVAWPSSGAGHREVAARRRPAAEPSGRLSRCLPNPRGRSLQADLRGRRGQERGLRAAATRDARPPLQGDRPARLRRLPRRRSDDHRQGHGPTSGRRFPEAWRPSANPVRSYTLLNHESPEFVRFVNPGDLRVAHIELRDDQLPPQRGAPEPDEHDDPRRHALGGGALQQRLVPAQAGARSARATACTACRSGSRPSPLPTTGKRRSKASCPYLDPLPRFEVTQPGNILRIFERGGRLPPEVGLPNPSKTRAGRDPGSATADWAPGTARTRSSSA